MSTYHVRPEVRALLEELSAAGRSLDPEAQSRLWAEAFLSLDPNRAAPVAREAMLAEHASTPGDEGR